MDNQDSELNKESELNYIIFPETEEVQSLKIDLTKLNEIQKKVVLQALKMLNSKNYIYIFGGGHGTNSSTNFASIITKDKVKFAGTPTRKTNKLSYYANPSFYDNLEWDKKGFYYGLDCSSFIYCCYNLAGINIQCNIAAQYPINKNFKEIKKEELKPGDIISYSVGHVIIFLGFVNIEGVEKYYCIHAPDSGNFLKTAYYKIEGGIPLTYVKAKFNYLNLFKSLILKINCKKYMNDKTIPYLLDSFSLFKRFFLLILNQNNSLEIFNIYYQCFLPIISLIFQTSKFYLSEENYSIHEQYLKSLNDIERNNLIKKKLNENNELYVGKIKLIKDLINSNQQEKVVEEIIFLIKNIFEY